MPDFPLLPPALDPAIFDEPEFQPFPFPTFTPTGEITLRPLSVDSVAVVGTPSLLKGTAASAAASTQAQFQLFINQVDRAQYLLKVDGAIDITWPIGGRATARLRFVDEVGTYRPDIGQRVSLFNGLTLLFSGGVETITEAFHSSTSCMVLEVTCSDTSIVLDRRTVQKEYRQDRYPTLLAILQDLVANFLDGELLTLGTVTTAVTLTAADRPFNFNGTVREAFNELAQFFQVDYHVDFYGVIYFKSFASDAAPFSLADNDGNIEVNSVTVSKSRGQYANRYCVKGSASVVSTRTDTFTGDGVTTSWSLQEPILSPPTVLYTRGSETIAFTCPEATNYYLPGYGTLTRNPVGIPIAYGFFLYYFHGEFELHGPALAVGESFTVTYGAAPSTANTICVQDDAQIAARAAIEGGSGIYERIEEISGIASQPAVLEYAEGQLARFASIPTQLQYDTARSGLQPGQTQSVNLTRPLASGSFLIEQVQIRAIDGLRLIYSVSATSGQHIPSSYRDFFAKAIQQTKEPLDRIEIKATFVINTIEVAADAGNHIIAPENVRYLRRVDGVLKEAPTGSALIIDVLRKPAGSSTWTSVFASSADWPAAASGETFLTSHTKFVSNPYFLDHRDLFRVDIKQIGVTTPGVGLTVFLYMG